MSRLRYLGCALVVSGGLFLAPNAADAQGNEPIVTPACGNYMIFVKAYSGDPGRRLALELINEIRTKYKLPAYYFNKGAEERDRQRAMVAKRREKILADQAAFVKQIGMEVEMPAPRIRVTRIEEQFAVVVGGWETMDEARKYLDYIRRQPPPAEKFMDGWIPPKSKDGEETAQLKPTRINPFQTSFVVPNPALADAQDEVRPAAARTNQITDPATLKKLNDPVVKKFNDGIENSILDCPKPWTLMVKFYPAPTVVQTSGDDSPILDALGLGNSEKSYLTAVAEQSHTLAKVLQGMGYPAYVMHTQYASMVTIGAYDGPNDPALLQAKRTIAGLKLRQSDKLGRPTGPVLETLAMEPMQMPVPFKH